MQKHKLFINEAVDEGNILFGEQYLDYIHASIHVIMRHSNKTHINNKDRSEFAG